MPDNNIVELKTYLENLRVPFLLCYPAKSFLNSKEGLSFLENFTMKFGNDVVTYQILANTLKDDHLMKMALDGLEASILKSTTVDTIEAVRKYCERTNQTKILTTQDWYQFFRMVRNCFSHDNIWNFNDYDRKILPITYGGKTIEESMDGTEIRWEFYNAHIAWRLFEDVKEFVDKQLR